MSPMVSAPILDCASGNRPAAPQGKTY
uniref:Uncharacterized protein n=1 Tax=Anguilla anguilla TaxID=7936 RepID=A0A0E9UP46_ANGAN